MARGNQIHEEGECTETSKENFSETSTAVSKVSDDLVDIPNDVYSMFFLSNYGGQAFWYAIYVTTLKMALYTFLVIEAVEQPMTDDVDFKVVAAQFLSLPISVAIQDDLTAFFFTTANVKYSMDIQKSFPDASPIKYYVANAIRGVDGFYSLSVNIMILSKVDSVFELFLSFAALSFLQAIDNVAFHLCLDGYLSNKLNETANFVLHTKFPRKSESILSKLDSYLFGICYMGVLIAWIYLQFGFFV